MDHVAQEFLGVALARELSAALAGKKILLPRSERARPDLPAALKSESARTSPKLWLIHGRNVGAIDPAVMQAVREAEVDVISLFSPSAIENMRAVLGEDVVSRLGARAALAAVGPVTAAALRGAGIAGGDRSAAGHRRNPWLRRSKVIFPSRADSKARSV